jgi:tripartite-type tricarboxylate transporter receptor subunit TctC
MMDAGSGFGPLFAIRHSLFALAIVLGTVPEGQAQQFPAKSIKLVSPFPAGGPNDAVARVAARAIQSRLGQTVVVENIGGAGGTLGARAVATAAPDGYTLLLVSVANNFGTQPVLYKLGFDPMKALVPVASLVTDKQLMVANPGVPFGTATELVAYSRANPEKLNYGAPIGIGTHFIMELFKIKSGAKITHVPYRGSGPIITDVIGGQIQLMMSGKSVLLPLVQAGKLRAIAVGAAKRWPELPKVQTLVEAGLLDDAYDTIYGLAAPMGTPKPTIEILNAAVSEGLRSDEVRASLDKLGVEPMITTLAEFSALVPVEASRWAEIVRVTGIKAGD